MKALLLAGAAVLTLAADLAQSTAIVIIRLAVLVPTKAAHRSAPLGYTDLAVVSAPRPHPA